MRWFSGWTVAKKRVRLDVRVGTGLVGAEAECARSAPGRGRLLLAEEEKKKKNASCLNVRDIAGNEFCLD